MSDILIKIYRISLKFLYVLTLNETYELVIEEALKLVKADYGSIFLYEDDEFKRVYTNNPNLYKIQIRKRGNTFKVFKTHKPMVLNSKDVKNIPHQPAYKKVGIEYKSDLMVPLFYRGKSMGVLSMISHNDKFFTKQDINTLTIFAPVVTLAIRKSQLNDDVQKALEARDLFISMAAHELRTPLTTINGYVQLLQTKITDSATYESKWLKELSWETQRLTILVNELLEAERIKRGEFRYVWKTCSLREILNRALGNFHFTYPRQSVVLDDRLVDGQDKIIADYDKILQVLNNLLENAGKYSPQNSKIQIFLKSRGGNLLLSVKDEGKGIPKSSLPKLFEIYYRGSNQTQEGIGLGLYLAKKIITKHNGDINIKSKEGKGTTVEIKLPRTKI